jgi:general secretion pathway protein E/type IV pilus assembly protein PilB
LVMSDGSGSFSMGDEEIPVNAKQEDNVDPADTSAPVNPAQVPAAQQPVAEEEPLDFVIEEDPVVAPPQPPLAPPPQPAAEVDDIIGETEEPQNIQPPQGGFEPIPTAQDVADAEGEGKVRIGDRLLSAGIITQDQLNVALQEKKESGKLLGEVLVALGFVTDGALSAILAERTGFEVFDPKKTFFDSEALELVEKNTALKHQALPLTIKDGKVHVAMSDPYDVMAMDAVRRFMPKGYTVVPVISTPQTLSEAIDQAYGYASSIKGILKELEEDGETEIDLSLLADEASFSHPIVRLVNALVFDAVKLGVSDLHFEPEENFVRLRYRKDGVLYTAQTLHKMHWSAMSQRLKIMSGMNIADKLSPQDGRFHMSVGGRVADFRVSSLPTVHGENIVLRVLDQSASIMPMEALGFSDHNLALIKSSQAKPEGIIIVTGPTGSGKTTSLYSMLNEINDVEVNIQTLEDPVEYSLPMIRQTHVREGVLEFADGIKALLRQDPDIIFIGEIRDGETAGMALKAAMTGHQVYTTLHTNDSFGAIPRLFDLGLKPGMVAGAIVSVFAQRLVRVLCDDCKEPYTASAEECELLGVDVANPPEIQRAKVGGCRFCDSKGYRGRTAVVEILKFDEELDELLAAGRSKAEIKTRAVEKGFKSMRDDGILKILEGKTSLEALAKSVDIRG